MTPLAHLPTLTSPRRTCAPPSLTLALVLTCPRLQRRRGGDDATTIAIPPSSPSTLIVMLTRVHPVLTRHPSPSLKRPTTH
jgi:hypothetical protein